MTPTIRPYADADAVSRAAAEEFVRCARDSIAARGRFTVALSGGSTPRRLYQLLAEPPYRDQVDWPHVEFFWGDERAVPPDHPDSNFRMANDALLHKLAIAPDHIHRMQAERPNLDEAARAYQAEIGRVFAVASEAAPPSFDLVLLGLGPDGHTASLFPFTAALSETQRWVVANHVPRLNANRLTLTTVILNRAAEVIFLVVGPDKAAVLAEVIKGPPDPERLPAQRIQPSGGQLVWMVDGEAFHYLRVPVEPR